MNTEAEFIVTPDPDDPGVTTAVRALTQDGHFEDVKAVTERPITLYLNKQEIVTLMTVGAHPRELAVGYLLNQNMIARDDEITGIDFDDELGVVIVRTPNAQDVSGQLKKRTHTSGCAQGTVFGSMMDKLKDIRLTEKSKIHTRWLVPLLRKINIQPSLYLSAGAIHGCVLCEEDRPLIFIEDIGRHNAVDSIAGYMHLNDIAPENKIFFTTGRLTSEMVIKCVQMGIAILVSRSGFTSWGVELANQSGLTMIARARGKRFMVMSGANRVVFDTLRTDS